MVVSAKRDGKRHGPAVNQTVVTGALGWRNEVSAWLPFSVHAATAAKARNSSEVTPDKKVIWVLQDWKDLGDATAVQILDDPGVPENPGETEH